MKSMFGRKTAWGILVYRRDSKYPWLRPYNDFFVGTWPMYIKRVNKRRKKNYGTITS